MSRPNTYDVAITAQTNIETSEVSQDELRLLSTFFPEILKEMMQYMDDEE